MKSRSAARERVLQALYQRDLSSDAAGFDADPGAVLASMGCKGNVRDYAVTLLEGVIGRMEELDRLLSDAADNWSVDRMGVVDRNLLRLAAFEILFSVDVPYRVAIDEALELAKRFGSEESSSFINGILDRVAARKKAAQA